MSELVVSFAVKNIYERYLKRKSVYHYTCTPLSSADQCKM